MIRDLAVHSWFARNPLGIIALFISLIYGMSALLLGQTIGLLTAIDQRILIIFIVVFPFVVLGVFSWLVSCHHKKLYGPGDYKSDDAFQKTWSDILPENIGNKLVEEVKEELTVTKGNKIPEDEKSISQGANKINSQISEAYLAEGLVFQELQSEFNGPIRRGVALRTGAVIDGIIEPLLGPPVLVEIKRLRSGIEIERRIREACYQLINSQDYSNRKHNKNYRAILALVVDNPMLREKAFSVASTYVVSHNFPIECRIFVLPELLEKYNVNAK